MTRSVEGPRRKKRQKNELPLLCSADGQVSGAIAPADLEERAEEARVLSPVLDARPFQTCDSKMVTEIYDWNFHMQPRILSGVLTKGYFKSETYVLKQGKTILAVATAKKHTVPDYSFCEILLCASNIYYRNCGAASLLNAVVVEKAKQMGCKFVLAWSAYPARNFWVKLGFRQYAPSDVELKYFRRTSLVFDRTLLMLRDLCSTDGFGMSHFLRRYSVTELRDSINSATWVQDTEA